MGQDFGRRLGRFVGLENPPTLVARSLHLDGLTASRLQWQDDGCGIPVRMDSSDGYLVCLQRHDLLACPYWVNGKPTEMMPLYSGQFLFLDLTQEHASVNRGTVDCVSTFVSREALDRFVREHGLRAPGTLRAASGVAHDDATIRNLAECLVPSFERPESANPLFFDHVALALLSHLVENYCDRPLTMPNVRGGLAPWQVRVATELLLANMDGKIGLAELARACELSRSHFARAFKATTGMSPLRWLATQRIEQARKLLLGTSLPLDDIAHACGFVDQSHFTRSFQKFMNVTPGRWRRLQRV